METKKETTRYPNLSEQGEEAAIKIIDSFKERVLKIQEETMTDLYCDVLPYIESDAWQNFRSTILNDLCNYRQNREKFSYDYKRIRDAIYKENKELIIKDLNQDLLKKIEDLESRLQSALNREQMRY